MDTLTIECPLCRKEHMYELTVHRITIRYMNGRYGPWYDKKFTRIFNCPNKKEKFQADFILSESKENLVAEIIIKE